MPITITVNNIQITRFHVEFTTNCVIVFYYLVDSTGQYYGTERTVRYWAILPSGAGAGDYQLPAQYAADFVAMFTAATAAIKAKEGL